MISFFVLRVSLRAHRDWQISALKTVKTLMADSFLTQKPGNFLGCFIHESDLAIVVRGENAIGNAVEDDVKESIGFGLFHGNDHNTKSLQMTAKSIHPVFLATPSSILRTQFKEHLDKI